MEPYMVSTTVINYDANGQQTEIEQAVAEAVAETSPEEIQEETPVEAEAPSEEIAL